MPTAGTPDAITFDSSTKPNALEVFADVLNVFDTNPPLDPINYAGVNYNPTFTQAGIVGRFFKVGVRVKL